MLSGQKRKITHTELLNERQYELDEMSAVNNKFMHYMFRLRKLDENLKVMDDSIHRLKTHHQKDVAHHRSHTASSTTELRKQIKVAQARLDALHPEIKSAEAKLSSEKRTETRILSIVDDLKKENEAASASSRNSAMAVLEAEQVEMQIKHDISFLEIEKASLLQQLESAKQHTRDANHAAVMANKHAKQSEIDYARQKQEKNRALDQMRGELAECKRKKTELEESLRLEFKQALDSQMQELQENATKQKNEEINEAKLRHQRVYGKQQNQKAQADRENDDLRQRVVEAELQQNALETRIKGDENVETLQSRKCSSLEQNLAHITGTHAEALLVERRKIESQKVLLEEKDQEYQELVEEKNALDMEIKAYRLLLENEEDRLVHVQQPRKKSRQSTTQSEAAAETEDMEDDTEAPQIASRTRSRRARRASQQ
jgi:hypothetical protein